MAHTLPLYVQIQEQLRSDIKTGEFKPGEKLPSENELAQQYSTTRATVVHAMQGLMVEGLIERIRGKGTFVKASPIISRVSTQEIGFFEKDLQDAYLSVRYKVLQFNECASSAELQAHLKAEPQDKIYRLMRLRLVQDKPLALEIRYLKGDIARKLQLEGLEMLPLQVLFEQQLGVVIHTIHNQIRVALPGQEIAQTLECKRTRPMMVRQHTCLTGNDAPVLWGETWYREEYEFQYSTYRKQE
ncbi:GntR family transcriptional regulator [Escherichia fergusonii]|uniref:GntR family transcriptional regulator n=1 Tax=Escherichia fergusonii TaxID=564 RepID=A0A7W3ELZ2_ESCFE|nr:GntR family transcriptional regulator [Escherichia fergusonii]EHG6166405.1 GntR family transcriptional regulator [Escherichia fergusonii]EHG7566867.1 GntR family transcriptional regulator [Escherichia fergusonii]MBA8234891.1 GntR family transcriptional regulator [Escherichia fergusonii]MBA8242510.1 GntR family transcriptional regulator [Escherichia fergusonii]MBA8277606.1 GntR family transcriptional regulator [Escherichia fergusonii]